MAPARVHGLLPHVRPDLREITRRGTGEPNDSSVRPESPPDLPWYPGSRSTRPVAEPGVRVGARRSSQDARDSPGRAQALADAMVDPLRWNAKVRGLPEDSSAEHPIHPVLHRRRREEGACPSERRGARSWPMGQATQR